MADTYQLLVASNRGPISLVADEQGRQVVKRGGGGLVSGLQSALSGVDSVWVCSALTDRERVAARRTSRGKLADIGIDTNGIDVRMLPVDASTFHRAYNGIANSTLWFVNHLLYDNPTKPVFDTAWRRQWQAYERYDRAFAEALAEDAAAGATVLVQDYHLMLTPGQLRARRPDLRIGHFTHTPWAPPDYFSILPDDVARAVLTGILGADQAGFLARRWADAFIACCEALLGAKVDRDSVTYDGRTTEIGIYPLGVDGDELMARASQADVTERVTEIRELIGDRRVIARVDRTELSKNIVRGLLAYREMLRRHPEWHGRVCHVAFAYPSRHDLPEYREYTAAVQRIGREIDDEFADGDWSPMLLAVVDDYAGSLAAYRLAEVMVVNPLRDGMNLVAKEAAVLSEPGCALVLSRDAGAADELRDALLVNPYDVVQTADAVHLALSMTEEERRAGSRRLAETATRLPPAQWFTEQVRALGH